jgi:hypothetical protein
VPKAATSLDLFDLVDARLEIDALARERVQVGRRHDRVGLRHALRVGLVLRVEHVVEGREAVAPVSRLRLM